jgi:hypothetical protein
LFSTRHSIANLICGAGALAAEAIVAVINRKKYPAKQAGLIFNLMLCLSVLKLACAFCCSDLLALVHSAVVFNKCGHPPFIRFNILSALKNKKNLFRN